MTATLEEPTTETTAQTIKQQTHANVGSPLTDNMWLVIVSIHCPTGQSKIPDAKVVTKDEQGNDIEVKPENHTPPRHKWKNHEIWAKFEANKRLIQAVLNRYSAVTASDGVRQVPGSCLEEMGLKIFELQEQRRQLIQEYISHREEIVSSIKAQHPRDWEAIVAKHLPTDKEALQAFDSDFTIWQLTPVTADKIQFQKLNPADQMKFAKAYEAEIEKHARNQARAVLQDLIGGMMEEIEKVNAGEYSTGRRRDGALNPILSAVEKLLNFSQILDKDALAKLETAKGVLSQVTDISQLNSSPALQKQIKQAIADLEAPLKKVAAENDPGSGRVARSVAI